MNTIKFTCLISLVFLVGCSSKLENKDQEITASQVINGYFEAIGSYENLKKIETILKQGHYIEPAYNIVLNAKIQKRRPNFRIIGDIESSGFEEGYNGTAWEYHKNKGLILSEGEAKEVIIVSSEFDYPFVDAEEKGHKVSYKGIKYIGAIKTYDIEVTMDIMNAEYITNFYFDIHSYLLIGQRKIMPIHAVGEDVEMIVSYSDYRNISGVLFPFSQIERNEKTGKFLNATVWNEIIINKNIPLSTFDPPIQNN
jgi:hypothetical protein